jgi:DNA-binding SARP family transcriptional activator
MAQHAYALEEARLGLLGGFTFQDADLPLAAQRLVAFLALQERAVRRDYVAGRLWPEASETRAHGALRTTLWRVARAAPEVLWVAGPHLALAGQVVVDVYETAALARSVIDGVQRTDHRELSVAGDLLPDWYDDWVVFERERLRQLRLHALEILCERHVRSGRFAEAVEAGLAAVTGDPLRESAHRVLIGAYLAQSNASDALRQYDLYRRHLAEELGLVPSPRMRALLASVHEPPVSRAD